MSMGSRLRSCGECGRTHYDGECSVINDLRTRLATAGAHIAELKADNQRLRGVLERIKTELATCKEGETPTLSLWSRLQTVSDIARAAVSRREQRVSFTIEDRGTTWVVHDLSELPRKPDQMGGRTFSHEARWSRFCSICNQGREAV